MTIHIGKILSQLFEARRIRKAALARMMHVHPVQINQYLKNESIQTSRLLELCLHLKHNFFMDIAQQVPADFATAQDVFEEKNKEIIALQEELKKVTIERDLLLQLQQKK